MTRGLKPIYAGNVRATPFNPQPAYNPRQPYPYFIAKMMYETGPKVVAVESPYRGWPRTRLQSGILV